MPGSSGGQLDQHRKGGLCRGQCYALDAEQGFGDWALWLWSWEWEAEWWLLGAGSWHCDWRQPNRPWGLFYVLCHVLQENTVASLCINKPCQPSETPSGSSESWSWYRTPWKHLSGGWYHAAKLSLGAAAWTASRFKHLFSRLPFTSLNVPFSGYWHLRLPFCWLTRVRKHLWKCENDTRCIPCSSMLHHRGIFIQHIYWILTMPVCTQLPNWMWDTKWGFLLVETGLQLHAAPSWFHSSPSQSIEKPPHMT